MNTAVNWNLIREARLFLHLLNEEQKAAFLTLAYRVSLADGEDDLDEVSALEDIKAQMHYDGTPEMSEVLGDLPLAVFQTPKARAVAMMESLMITYADGYLHDAEAKIIGEIAQAFEFDQTRLNQMAEWAMDGLDLMRSGGKILDVVGS
ncbi:MAG: hypothetical protein HOL41_17905 [Rhodospirillaceae bacterium]|nr:hypothetical protein [Rhodospirillaceae bacterium]MBT6086267.1 hypothetical protein [Rhodospirillaceae bacterium]